MTPEKAATLCDLDAREITEVARIFAKADRAATKIDLGIYHGLYMLESVYLERILLAITGRPVALHRHHGIHHVELWPD